MNETLALIQRAANERHLLYRLAAKHQLSAEGKIRLNELNGEIPVLWDQHRREVAAQHFKPYSYGNQKQAA